MCPENTDTELIKKCLDGNLFFFFHAWEENNKTENIWLILPVHKHYFYSKLKWLARHE